MTEYKPEELYVIADDGFNIKKVFDNENDAKLECVEMRKTNPLDMYLIHKLSVIGKEAYVKRYDEGYNDGYDEGHQNGIDEAEDDE